AARGLAVTIHRPAAVTGDSRSGVWNTGDFLCRVIKGCIQLRKAPRIDESLDWVPVDYVSAAIVFLSGRPEFIGRISHLTNPAAGSTAQLVASIRARGYPLEAVSLGEWAEYAARNVAADPEHVLYPLLPLLEGWRGGDDEADSAAGQYACAATLAMLAQGNIDRPTRPDALFTRYLSYLADCGFIPPPAGAAGDDREFEQRRLI
ncbi:SDR family oxidoreductase, partial [Methylogaea oryzae]